LDTTDVDKVKEQLSRILAVIDQPYVDALLTLHRKLAKQNIEWAVTGELGEALRTVQVKPDCIEIVTSKKGAAQIFLAVQEYSPTGVFFQTHQLPRNAELGGKEYPVYMRSHYFDFVVGGVKVKVYGDLQFKIADWDWGDKLEFTPEYIYVVGLKTAVVPLQVKYEIYQNLGWTDRAEKISQVITRRPPVPR